MTPEAQALARALLAHQKNISRDSASQSNLESFVISYTELCERAGVPEIKSLIGRFLREIATWCSDHGWPPLNALAVNHTTRKPGSGYDKAPGCSVEAWPDQLAACISFTGYPEEIVNA